MAFLITLYSGACFHVAAFADDQKKCKVFDFLQNDPTLTDADRRRLNKLMEKMAVHGRLSSERQSKLLEDGIYEFKAPGGARLLWFYDAGKIVVASNGFTKKKDKTPRSEIEIAVEIRKKYLEAKSHENIRTLTSFQELGEP